MGVSRESRHTHTHTHTHTHSHTYTHTHTGMRECPDRFYGKMEKVVHILTQTGHMDRMAAFVVETASVQDILRFQVRTFLSYTPHTVLCILSQHTCIHIQTHVPSSSSSSSSCRSTLCLPWHCTIVVRGSGGERVVPRGLSLTM